MEKESVWTTLINGIILTSESTILFENSWKTIHHRISIRMHFATKGFDYQAHRQNCHVMMTAKNRIFNSILAHQKIFCVESLLFLPVPYDAPYYLWLQKFDFLRIQMCIDNRSFLEIQNAFDEVQVNGIFVWFFFLFQDSIRI